MEQIEIFKNSEFGEIRTIMINYEPWFVGKDVATALGYINPRKALIDHVDDEDKGVTKRDTLGGAQNVTIINESGLYSLILSSKLDSAKRFKHWITNDVIPAIRKTGSYSVQKSIQPSLDDRKMKAAEWAANFLNMNEVSKLKMVKSILEPLGLPCPDYVESRGLVHSATELLKSNNINMSVVAFNKLLVENGYLREVSRQGKNKIHHFKVISEKGLAYGENLVNDKNPNETQPKWYDNRFLELCNILNINDNK